MLSGQLSVLPVLFGAAECFPVCSISIESFFGTCADGPRAVILPSKNQNLTTMRASIEEYRAVEEAARKFVRSVAEGKSSHARELFIDEAVLFGYLDGKLEHGSIEQFYRNVDSVGADAGFRARIDVLDVEETLAVVRVLEENWGGRIDFTDYLLLMKIDGRWRCVAKAYNQNSDTIQK